MDELPDSIYTQVTDLSERGNVRMEAGLYDEAIALWEQALRLIPQPEAKWDAALWLHASIADALRSMGAVSDALRRFQVAARCADGATNPFVLFSIGACEVDLGHEDAAVDPLLRAYMLEGDELFADQDPRYFDLLRRRKLVD